MTQQYLQYMKKGDLGVMIFADSGRAYLSKGFYGETEVNKYIPPKTAIKNRELSF